ncbi:hypothetical protein QEZ54_28495 [Catellatospora sp. KI3]|uniref:hypothetical protein n=1 Tax=Catellatospora sp. KI3 TaxID=3041620 RepID=UPI002483259B|nr:hypothetical protein [Catellatospora sp. KI3]MDI1464916.1 hypothetical protein [Catellatospora sp. KI3]
MRRALTILGTTLATIMISAPAYAYAHDRVRNPYLHALLDVLTLAVVTAPVWTAFTWSRGRRTPMLLVLIGLVQIPAGVLAFVPIPNPVLHTAALIASLGITAASIVYVRREARAAVPAEVVG